MARTGRTRDGDDIWKWLGDHRKADELKKYELTVACLWFRRCSTVWHVYTTCCSIFEDSGNVPQTHSYCCQDKSTKGCRHTKI